MDRSDAFAISTDNKVLVSMRDTGDGGQVVSSGRGGDVLQINIAKFGASTKGTIIDQLYLEGRTIGLEKCDISALEIGPVLTGRQNKK